MSETNRFEFTDEKITAYALGELSAEERTEIESRSARDPALRAHIAEIREFASVLAADLGAEPAPSLTSDQQAKVLAGKAPWWRMFVTPKALGLEAALAAALVVVMANPTLFGSRTSPVVGDYYAPKKAEVAAQPLMMKKQGLGAAAPTVNMPAAAALDEETDSLSGSSQRFGAVGRGGGIGGAAGGALGGGAVAGSLKGTAQFAEGAGAKAKDMRRIQAPMDASNEAYSRIDDNPFLVPTKDPLSTFSIDVDTASYANLRRFLENGQLPPKDAVRIEEMVNYFNYTYPEPTGSDPFSVTTEMGPAPWAPTHRLMKIGLKGKSLDERKRPAANLVFLVDVSGSMDEERKLPLLKESLKMLVEKLDARDRVSLVTYADGTKVVLEATPGNQKDKIVSAIDKLVAGGGTNGEGGIQLAYRNAQAGFLKEGANRVILATDGDFNVGVSDPAELTRMIEEKAKGGVNLSVLGFGMGNYKDATLESLSAKGHGNYAYIDSKSEARKVLVEQMGGTLFTIARDVKLQLEFNPAEVNAYRLIGYENRLLRAEDFNNDKKEAGDIGAGHTVTAIYEIVPKGASISGGTVDALKYQKPAAPTESTAKSNGEVLTVKLRYKDPGAETSKLLTHVVKDEGKKLGETSTDYRWAAAVAGFGMILRDSPHKGEANFSSVLDLATSAKGADVGGYRAGMIELMQKAKAIPSTPVVAPGAVKGSGPEPMED